MGGERAPELMAADGKKRGRTSPKGGTPQRRTKADQRVAEGKQTGAQATLAKAELYKTIYRSWRRGINCTTLAERHDMTPRRVQQLIDEMRAASVEAMKATSPLAGLKLIDEQIIQRTEAVTLAAEVTERAIENRNWAAALGGLKRTAAARNELLSLQQERGIVPKNIALLEHQALGVELVQRIMVEFERFNVPDQVAVAVAATIQADARRGLDGHLELSWDGGEKPEDPFLTPDDEVDAEVVG